MGRSFCTVRIHYCSCWLSHDILVYISEEKSRCGSITKPNCSATDSLPAKAASLAPWFPPHLQRNIYLSLLHLEPEEGAEKAPKVPDSVLRAALLRRAVEDINRIIQVRTAKQSCGTLLQRGSVGDDLWQRLLRAEKEMEEELRDVVMEVRRLHISRRIID